MSRQDFFNGGFYGKLGNTVGRRWKDKRILQTYTIPANPRTPAQQSNRALFATACRLAQQAMTVNGHDGLWDTSKIPEFSARLGQALRALREGKPEADAFPLYPDGYSPAITLDISGYTYPNTYTLVITLDTSPMTEDREVKLVFSYLRLGTANYATPEITATIGPAKNTVTYAIGTDFDNYTDIECAGASTDDAAHGGKAIQINLYSAWPKMADTNFYAGSYTAVERPATNQLKITFAKGTIPLTGSITGTAQIAYFLPSGGNAYGETKTFTWNFAATSFTITTAKAPAENTNFVFEFYGTASYSGRTITVCLLRNILKG